MIIAGTQRGGNIADEMQIRVWGVVGNAENNFFSGFENCAGIHLRCGAMGNDMRGSSYFCGKIDFF